MSGSSKKQVVYIHGGTAYSKYGDFIHDLQTKCLWELPGMPKTTRWTDTLAQDVGEGFEVFSPIMPNKHNAKYNEWKIWFERYHTYLSDNVTLIGFSLGGMFLIKYLLEEQVSFGVKNLYLVAAPVTTEGLVGEDGGDFAFNNDRLGELAAKVQHITIFHSKDDFVVPYAHAELLKSALPDATLCSLEGRGHFLNPEFPELLESLKRQSIN